jgi:hypothetical protein
MNESSDKYVLLRISKAMAIPAAEYGTYEVHTK